MRRRSKARSQTITRVRADGTVIEWYTDKHGFRRYTKGVKLEPLPRPTVTPARHSGPSFRESTKPVHLEIPRSDRTDALDDHIGFIRRLNISRSMLMKNGREEPLSAKERKALSSKNIAEQRAIGLKPEETAEQKMKRTLAAKIRKRKQRLNEKEKKKEKEGKCVDGVETL